MAKIEGNCKDIIDKAEWVAVATTGVDGPQLSATWGDYIRTLGIRDGEIVLVPIAGYYGKGGGAPEILNRREEVASRDF